MVRGMVTLSMAYSKGTVTGYDYCDFKFDYECDWCSDCIYGYRCRCDCD